MVWLILAAVSIVASFLVAGIGRIWLLGFAAIVIISYLGRAGGGRVK